MKKIPLWIIVLSILFSCSNKKTSGDSLLEDVSSYGTLDDSVYTDTIKDVPIDQVPMKTSTNSSYSSTEADTEEPDNMRGWDPASEDDMPDNGMSRYMENNDEEGWD